MIKDKKVKGKKAKTKKSKWASVTIAVLTLINLSLALVLKIRERKEIIKIVKEDDEIKALYVLKKETRDKV